MGDGDLPPGLRAQATRLRPGPRQTRRLEGHPKRLRRIPESSRGARVISGLFRDTLRTFARPKGPRPDARGEKLDRLLREACPKAGRGDETLFRRSR